MEYFLIFLLIIGSIYYLIIFSFILSLWMSFYYDLYIVTKDTIIDISQLGFFGRKVSQLSLLRVQDVSAKTNGFLHTVFAYGDVLVETAGENAAEFLLEAVPNPQEFSARILQLHNQLVEEQGQQQGMVLGEGEIKPSNQPPSNLPPSNPSKTPAVRNLPQSIQQEDINNTQHCPSLKQVNQEGEVNTTDLNQGGEIKL